MEDMSPKRTNKKWRELVVLAVVAIAVVASAVLFLWWRFAGGGAEQSTQTNQQPESTLQTLSEDLDAGYEEEVRAGKWQD